MALTIKGVADPALIALPWHLPLDQWPPDIIAALPRGLSRHVVRFAHLGDRILAIKETSPELALREVTLLRQLQRLGAPTVTPLAIVTGRESADGEDLEAALVTAHLQFSLPYRALFSQSLREETVIRFVDALAVLLVRLHLLGFYWGDVSLSNALFRRDAAEFTAYLVDAETGELHSSLTDGQRSHDLELARTNILGEMFDLEAQEALHENVEPLTVAERLETRYAELWGTLTETETETVTTNLPLRINERVQRLNDLGFDIAELDVRETEDGQAIVIRPKVVDAGHHARRLMRLTGLDVQENQARRLLNDLDEFHCCAASGEDESYAAHQWLITVFEPTVRAVPRELRTKLEPAQIFHEVLDHRWFLAETADQDVPMEVATASYIKHILPDRPDEKALFSATPEEMTAELPVLTAEVRSRSPMPYFDGDNTAGWGHPDDVPPLPDGEFEDAASGD